MTNNDTPAKKKLIAFLKKQHPEVEDKDIPNILNDIRRFVTVIQKIYSEPQAKVYYKDVSDGGRKVKNRYIDTNIEELMKLTKGTGKPATIEAFRELTEKVLKIKFKKYGQ